MFHRAFLVEVLREALDLVKLEAAGVYVGQLLVEDAALGLARHLIQLLIVIDRERLLPWHYGAAEWLNYLGHYLFAHLRLLVIRWCRCIIRRE